MENTDSGKQKKVCPQCGANEFKAVDATHHECLHCGALVETTFLLTDSTHHHILITDPADVKVKDHANVKIKGGLEVKGGTLTITEVAVAQLRKIKRIASAVF